MRPTLSTYFLRRYLISFGSTLIVVFALAYLIDMIELSRRSRLDDVGLGVLALISALRVPAFIEQAFPFVILFSSIFTLAALNQKMELVVARAAGVSVWQILAPFLLGSLLLGTAAIALYNPLAAQAQAASASLERQYGGSTGKSDIGDRTPWLRQAAEGQESIIGAKVIAESGTELGGVTVFILNADGVVSERVDAPTARLGDKAWIIDDASITRVGQPPERLATYRLPTSLLPEYIEQRLASPDTISVWQLGSKIDVARSLGYNAEAFAMRFHALLAQPMLFIAMTLIGATVAVRFSRLGQSGRTIVSGVAAGFVLYVVTFLAQALGSNSVVPAVVAAWFPVVAAGLFGVTVLLHQEDG